jgi:hypothetical protein
MPHFTDLAGLAGIALALAALCSLALGNASLTKRLAVPVAGAVFVLLLLPFAELPPAAYVRGMIGDFSSTTLVLLGYAVGRRRGAFQPVGASRSIGGFVLLVLAAGMLYPLALGAAPYDTYRWGYGEPGFLGLLLGIALAGIALRMPLVVLSICLAVLAWVVGWSESDNLWDYLLDPLLVIYALAALLRTIWCACRSRGASALPPSGS